MELDATPLAILLGALLAGPAEQSSVDEEAIARFQSDFGPVAITVLEDGEVEGTYPDYDGRLVGRLTGDGTIEAIWSQPESDVRCGVAKDGSHFWGRVRWAIAADGRLEGRWGHCDGAFVDQPWNAQPIEGTLVHAAASRAGVTEQHVYGVLREQWGRHAHLSEHRIVEGDFTCDGTTDRVIGWHDLDNPDGPFYRVMLVTLAGGTPEGHTVTLIPDGNGADGRATWQGVLEVTLSVEEWDDAAMGPLPAGLCATAIRIDDNMTDAVRLFWSPAESGREPLVLVRS
jgi:hypothetical protein